MMNMTAASAQASLDRLIARLTDRVTEDPSRVTDCANEIQHWRGIVDTLTAWEQHCAAAVEYHGAGSLALLLDHYEWISMEGNTSPDDEWSGRGNDGRRSYRDGQRAALRSIHGHVREQARATIQGASA